MRKLNELAKTIGWVEVGRENGAVDLEYTRRINSLESIRHILKLYDELSDVEFINAFGAIVDVLPRKLKKNIYKLTKHADINKKDDLLDLVTFQI